jgi:hypothetical protein
MTDEVKQLHEEIKKLNNKVNFLSLRNDWICYTLQQNLSRTINFLCKVEKVDSTRLDKLNEELTNYFFADFEEFRKSKTEISAIDYEYKVFKDSSWLLGKENVTTKTELEKENAQLKEALKKACECIDCELCPLYPLPPHSCGDETEDCSKYIYKYFLNEVKENVD